MGTSLFLLFLLGLITYLIVRRVSGVTRTPIWMLWLVAMTPAFIWTAWGVIKGGEQRIPPALVLIPFVVCLVLYWFLIQRGRISAPPTVDSTGSSHPGAALENASQATAEAATIRPINKAEEQGLQNCFPWSVFYLQNIEYRPQAVICRGQLRSKPEVAYRTVRENIETKFGDRFYVVFQEGPNGKPFFALVANPQVQQSRKGQEAGSARPGLAIGLLIVTFLTCALAWSQVSSQTPASFSWETTVAGVPYALALIAVLGCHETGHYLAARRYQLRATLPYFIPVPPIPLFPFGTFGAFVKIHSPIPDRRSLFDIGIAGPLSGFVVALPLLLWGLKHSSLVPLKSGSANFPDFQALDTNFSLLLSLLSKLMLGGALTPQTAINLHPVAVAACLGIVVTAFNLMPVGQLDGGQIVHAMFGQRVGAIIGQVSRVLLFLLALAQQHLMPWAIILFVLPAANSPALNDVTELDNRRDLWGLVALGLLLLIILPTPSFVANWLNL